MSDQIAVVSRDSLAIKFAINHLEANREEWFLPVLMMFVRDGLSSLQTYIEDPSSAASLQKPSVTLHWDMKWDWERWESNAASWAGPWTEGIVRLAETKGVRAVGHELVEHAVLNVLLAITSPPRLKSREVAPYGCVLEDGKFRILVPEVLWKELRIESLAELERESLIKDLFRPFTFDRRGLDRLNPDAARKMAENLMQSAADAGDSAWEGLSHDDVIESLADPLGFTLTRESGEDINISIRLEVRPYVVNVDEQKAYFSATVGIVDSETSQPFDLSTLSADELASFWDAAFGILGQYEGRPLGHIFRDLWNLTLDVLNGDAGGWSATVHVVDANDDTEPPDCPRAIRTSHPATPDPEPRYHIDGAIILDRKASDLVSRVGSLSLPKSWRGVRQWDKLVEDEISRLLADPELQQAARLGTDEHGPLLYDKPRPIRGYLEPEMVPTLTAEGESRLLERNARKWIRKLAKDHDGVTRECIVYTAPQHGGKFCQVSFSWYGRTEYLVDGSREAARRAAELAKKRTENTFFDKLMPDHQAEIEDRLQHMQAVSDGYLLMEHLLGELSLQGRNPITISSWKLFNLFEWENDPHRYQRILGCFRALQELRFEINAPGQPGGYSFGPFLGRVSVVGAGSTQPLTSQMKGMKGERFYRIQLGMDFVGCLDVFSTDKRLIDPTKTLSKEEKAKLGKEQYVKHFIALGAYYDRQQGFTLEQKRLRKWVEEQITRRKDARKDRRKDLRAKPNAIDANEPRIYDSTFCPLLEPGKRYHGALGHFSRRNPECGRKLYGGHWPGTAKSGPKTEGLLAVLGYESRSGKMGPKRRANVTSALKDFRAVIEEAMGGMVVAKLGSNWFTLEQAAASIPTKDLHAKVQWFLFPAEDWPQRLQADFEAYQHARYLRGETPFPVRVTRDWDVHKRSEEAIFGVHYTKAIESDAESDEPPVPLHYQLRAARKERGLSLKAAGALFGVSHVTMLNWETGPVPDEETGSLKKGKPIPKEMRPLIERWVHDGVAPTAEELTGRKTHRSGVNPITKQPKKPKRGNQSPP